MGCSIHKLLDPQTAWTFCAAKLILLVDVRAGTIFAAKAFAATIALVPFPHAAFFASAHSKWV
jgi:hypothetical protein